MIGEFLVSVGGYFSNNPGAEAIVVAVVVFFGVVWFLVRRSKSGENLYPRVPPQSKFYHGFGNVPNRYTLDVNVNLRLGKTARGLFKNFNFEDLGSKFDFGEREVNHG